MTPEQIEKGQDISKKLEELANRKKNIEHYINETPEPVLMTFTPNIVMERKDSPELFDMVITMALFRIDKAREKLEEELEALNCLGNIHKATI